jgi:hypothetical protein
MTCALGVTGIGLRGPISAPHAYADTVNQGDIIGHVCNANADFGGTHGSCVAFFTAYGDQSAQYAAYCSIYVGEPYVGKCVMAFNEIAKGTGS